MKNSMYKVVLLIMLTAIIGCKESTNPAGEGQKVKVRVEVIRSSQDKSPYYIGTVEESVSVPLSFLITGMVEGVYASEGQKVQKGRRLASVNAQSYQQAYEMALSKETQAEDAYRRLSQLYQKGSLPEIKFIEIETGLAQTRAATQIARKNLSDCELFSPTDGIIGNRALEPGENVVPLKTVMTLINIEKVFVKVSVPESEIGRIRKGQLATIQVPALNNLVFQGRITEKGVVANAISHTYEVKITVENHDEKLMPGMVCRVSLTEPDPASNVTVPLFAVQVDETGQKYVYLAYPSSEKVIKRQVQTGSVRTGRVIITQGLLAGDSIVTEGFQQLDEKSKIQIVNQDEN
jgi:RND family efflux transporter MFP subunit